MAGINTNSKMTQKQLLLQDLCARLPYGVKIKTPLNERKINMGNSIFSFNIGKYEFGMRKDFCWWFNNGYLRQFMWWYVFKND